MSIHLVGSSDIAEKLRVLVCLELFIHCDFYANHPILHNVFNVNKNMFSKFRSLLSITLSHDTTFLCLPNNCDEFLIKKEACNMCNDNKWASYMCVLALSSVVGRKICLFYPDFGPEKFRILFKNIIFPRHHYRCFVFKNETLESNTCLNLLYCNLSNTPNEEFQANHFVPLIKRKSGSKPKKSSSENSVCSSQEIKAGLKHKILSENSNL